MSNYSENINNNGNEDVRNEMKLLKEKYNALVEKNETDLIKYNALVEKNETNEAKYKDLVAKLRNRIECPVCLEVPEAGPVSVCPNGHLVCSKCKSDSCPTCRSKMFAGRSLLAVTVLDNIEHKCRNLGCDKSFKLTELQPHKRICEFRLVECPATLCTEKIGFCHIIDHLLNDCTKSCAKHMKNLINIKNNSCKQVFTCTNLESGEHYNCDTFLWEGKYFFLNMKKDRAVWTFNIEMLATEEECSEFKVELTVQQSDWKEDEKFHAYFGTPSSVEEAKEVKRMTGLMISEKIMNTKVLKPSDGEFDFSVTLKLSKK